MVSKLFRRTYARLGNSDDVRARDAKTSWLPYSLRWPALLAFALYNSILIVAIVILYWTSSKNFGLVDDDGSSGVAFASRFVPTLLAVAYVLVATIVLDDVKRTEPFALLARPNGALAGFTLLQKTGQWWTCLARSFRNQKEDRDMRWTLLCSTLIYVLGILVLSPFSAALLSTKEVLVPQEIEFSHMVLGGPTGPLDLQAAETSYFHTIAHSLQNVTTSAWVADDFFVFPFWPSTLDSAPLTPILSDEVQFWRAETTVLSTNLSCEPIKLGRKAWNVDRQDANTSFVNASIVLTSPSGCEYGIFLPWTYTYDYDDKITEAAFDALYAMAKFGGSSWSAPPSIALASPSNGAVIYDGELVNSTSCSGEMFFYMENPIHNDGGINSLVVENFKAAGHICKHEYHVADVEVTADLSVERSILTFDHEEWNKKKEPVQSAQFAVDQFQSLFLNPNWTYHLTNINASPPVVSGPAALLAAVHNFSMQHMIADPNILKTATAIKQRYLGEVVQDALSVRAEADNVSNVGQRFNVRRRVTAVGIAAVTLGLVLALQLALILGLYFASRASRRPLELFQDPASSLATAALLSGKLAEEGTRPTLTSVKSLANSPIHACTRYRLRANRLTPMQNDDQLDSDAGSSNTLKPGSGWLPRRLRWPTMLTLLVVLGFVLAAVSALYTYSRKSPLYQTFFVYQASVTIGSNNLGDFGPIPVITTLIAVMFGLWISSQETAMRRLQPFIAMSQGPQSLRNGAALSYESTYSLWAAVKAGSRGHWLLAVLALAGFLTQIVTIAMSALWQRDFGNLESNSQVPVQLTTRTVPFISQGTVAASVHYQSYQGDVLKNLYTDLQTNWLYGAAVQLSLNATEPPWSSQGWSFVPHDLSSITNGSVQDFGSSPSRDGTAVASEASINVTLSTRAVRARLECSPYEALKNESNWIRKQDLTNSSIWNVTANPKGIDTGYQLGCGVPNQLDDGLAHVMNLFPNHTVSDPCGSVWYTGFFEDPSRLICCVNDTSSGPGSAAIGYWSPNLAYQDVLLWSYDTYPYNFTIKWIHGPQAQQFYQVNTSYLSYLTFSEQPVMNALNCKPVIEHADADVNVDHLTGRVQSYNITSKAVPDPHAWSDAFRTWTNSNHSPNEGLPINVTTSYGIIFMDALLSSANLNLVGAMDAVTGYDSLYEDLQDLTFNIRSPGLNVDYMSYSMFSMVNKDPRALLDPKTLETMANKTIATFFQHFASSNVSMGTGGWVFQDVNYTLPSDIGKSSSESKRDDGDASRSANRGTADVRVSKTIVILKTSKIAAWVTMIILAWLIVTLGVVAILLPGLTKSLEQRVETIGDVAALVMGSEKLLNLAQTLPVSRASRTHGIQAKLGRFQTGQGGEGYGIEICSDQDFSELQKGTDVYQKIPTTAINPTSDEAGRHSPRAGDENSTSYVAGPQDSSNRHSIPRKPVSGTYLGRLASLRHSRPEDGGDIALLSMSRAPSDSHERTFSNHNTRAYGDESYAQLSVEEFAAIDYMQRNDTAYR